MVTDPLFVPQILGRVGPAAMADWLVHLAGLAAFTFLHWDAQVRLGMHGPGCPACAGQKAVGEAGQRSPALGRAGALRCAAGGGSGMLQLAPRRACPACCAVLCSAAAPAPPPRVCALLSHLLHLHSPTPPQKYVPLIDRLPAKQRYLMRRALDSWRYGSGKDYRL